MRRTSEPDTPIVPDPVSMTATRTPDSAGSEQVAPVVGLTNLRNVYSATEMVAHPYAVKGALDEILATMIGAETGQRGFVLAVRC